MLNALRAALVTAAALAVDPAPTTKLADGVSISMVALGTGSGQKGDVVRAGAESRRRLDARRGA